MASRFRSLGLLGGSARYLHLGDKSNNDQHELQSNASRRTIASETPLHQSSENVTLLGKPSRKKLFYGTDIVMAVVTLACLSMSVLVVSNSYISWYLGMGNRQLIVIGFLLSIMNLCLASVTPTLFILLEARFGKSTLQNYDGILRNKPLASKLSFPWRVVLVAMLALPVGLSVAYKTFTGGESSVTIHTTYYISNSTWFGLFRPPAIVSITGISSFLNATNSFRNATQRAASDIETDGPALPKFPQPYGYNILLLNKTSAASLDTLCPYYILALQELLAPGESLTITAPVIGTVATFNESAPKEEYESICTEKDLTNDWYYRDEDLYRSCKLTFADRQGHSDQSVQYIGLAPDNPNCMEYSPFVYVYNIYRRQCRGTWSISRSSFQLLNGSCDNTDLPRVKQQIIQWQYLALPSWYTGVLIEMLKTFCRYPPSYDYRGNQSQWMMPYMSVSVATMLWSAIISQQVTPFDSETFDENRRVMEIENKTLLSFKEASIFYHIDEDHQTVISIRPTLQKSPWLYMVLGIQPVLLLIILGMIALLHTVPLDKGFGMISILSGIERRTLDSLRGASLSGELKRPVKLSMSPVQGDGKNSISYRIDPSSKELHRNERLAHNVEYH